ncbi:MAG: hypothetical protein E7216_10545 [Clostridium thermopalmarium]|uniref:hypothetical protein n=1 Tax=Clostridium thermopalmarium TaxID=29373 RepID=UPI0023548A03|nr:hypothetical protein [Clostridium thermopalmarium]MBE6044651.1 hypothetical protein [Clostridium thermopalmarium]
MEGNRDRSKKEKKIRSKGFNNISETALAEAKALSNIGYRLMLIGDTIVVSTTDPIAILQAALIKLVAGIILTQSTMIYVNENRNSENPIPEELNMLKFIGSVLSIVGAVISTKVLFDETALGQVQASVIPPFEFIT